MLRALYDLPRQPSLTPIVRSIGFGAVTMGYGWELGNMSLDEMKSMMGLWLVVKAIDLRITLRSTVQSCTFWLMSRSNFMTGRSSRFPRVSLRFRLEPFATKARVASVPSPLFSSNRSIRWAALLSRGECVALERRINSTSRFHPFY